MAAMEHHLIGHWRFDVDEAILRSEQDTRPLEDRAARTLAVLCRRRGEIVARDELLAEVWHGRTVSPNSVAIVIGDLRRALDDDRRSPAHIVTIAKRGYRLTMPAEQPEAVQQLGRPRPSERSGRMGLWRVRPKITALAGLLVVLLVAVATAGVPQLFSQRPSLMIGPVTNETGLATYQPLANALGTVVTDRVARFAVVRTVSRDARLSAPGGTGGLQMISRLILWNGAPELALKLVDDRTGTVLWSAFATGPAGDLARSTSSRLDELDRRLGSRLDYMARRGGPA